MTKQRYLVLDFETFSHADLKRVGAWEYSCHDSTEIICAAWTTGTIDGPWSPVQVAPGANLAKLRNAMCELGIKIVAHNAYFEQAIIKNVMSRDFAEVKHFMPSIFVCTAAMAASHALPRNLEGACLALDLPVKKDMGGRRLILKYCKPRKASKNDPSTRWNDPGDMDRIFKYCKTDVEAERLLFESLPLLNDTEKAVWQLDQKINFRGFTVDRPLVEKCLVLIDKEVTTLKRDFKMLTGLTSANQRAKVLEFLEDKRHYLPNLQAKTVQDMLSSDDIDDTIRRVLETRQAISKTSTAKYEAFEARSRTDGRLRDNLLYHAASTGRWGGTGVQPQNFPRGNIQDTDFACEVIRNHDLETLHWLYSKPMEVFSSCLRGMIIPDKGHELFCADYAAIETRVLFWVANHKAGLTAFHENRDMYKEMASIIYRVPVDQVDKKQRQLGKAAFLGAGYGMGPKKFVSTCKHQNIDVEELIAESAIKAYRETHYPVVALWKAIERAAIFATSKPGNRFRTNHTEWHVERDFLYCTLPSKRRLAYYKPTIEHQPTPWGESRPVLYHYSVNLLSKQWESGGTYGGKLVENVVQAIARDLMAEAMLRIESAGFKIILSVHDEIVAEAQMGRFDISLFESLMAEVPRWAEGMPVKVEGFKGKRYRK